MRTQTEFNCLRTKTSA